MDVRVENQFGSPWPPMISYASESIADRHTLMQALLAMLSRLVPCDAISWNYVDLVTGAVVVEGIPAGVYDGQPDMWSLMVEVGDHPMINSYVDNPIDLSPRRMSDVVSTTDLHKTRAYAEVLRPTRSERQMTVVSGRDLRGGGRSFTLVRESGDFTDDELSLMADIQPILVALDVQLSRIDPSIPAEEVVRARTKAATSSSRGAGAGQLVLTARQTEILSLLSGGLTAIACAHLLRISEGTVRKHLENAYAKLGCHDRLSAVRRAKQLGLLH